MTKRDFENWLDDSPYVLKLVSNINYHYEWETGYGYYSLTVPNERDVVIWDDIISGNVAEFTYDEFIEFHLNNYSTKLK